MRLKIICFLILFSDTTFGQSYTILGEVRDTFGEPLISTSVMILDKDSLLLAFAMTDLQGKFEVSGVKKSDVLLKISYLGYVPRTLTFSLSQPNTHVGTVYLKELANELIQVVIKEAKAPIRLRGDTVEYDISQFKVPEGSTLEAILRRLPGISVQSDGSVEADGQQVRKLTIDGKTFFSDDPSFAVKTLPSEAVSKVQVFTHKDEEALMTGKASPQEEKAMNVELKEEYKKIHFGKMIAGAETESRGELKGNYNKFNKNDQFSILGLFHNTTKNGFSWDDNTDFFNSGIRIRYDNYEYGFGSLGSGNASSLENKISNGINLQSTSGFPYSNFGGFNYNFEKGKHKLTSRYILHQNGLKVQSLSNQRTFLADNTFDNESEKEDSNHGNNQKAEILWEYKVDSLHTVKTSVELGLVGGKNNSDGEQNLFQLTNGRSGKNVFTNTSNLAGYGVNSSFLWSKRFKKDGRGIAANVLYARIKAKENQNLFSKNDFFVTDMVLDNTILLSQQNRDTLSKSSYRANFIYFDKLSPEFQYDVFYNVSFRDENSNRLNETFEDGIWKLNNDQSRNLLYSSFNHRAGLNLHYTMLEVTSFWAGAALQELRLMGDFNALTPEGFSGNVDKKFRNIVPFFSVDADVSQKFRINLFYEQQIAEPDITDLFPIIDLRNPFYVLVGNPNLSPYKLHETDLRFIYTEPLLGSRISLGGFYNYYENQIIFGQTIDSNLVTFSTPVNYSGATEKGIRFKSSVSFFKNKVKMNLNSSVSNLKDFAIINDIINTSSTLNCSGNIQIDISPADNLSILYSSAIRFSDTRFEENETQNQIIWRHQHNLDGNISLKNKWFLGIQGRLSFLTNERFGINQQIPVFNVSVARQFLINNKAEIRLTMYDVLNQNVLVSQTTNAFQIVESRTTTLARYLMLTFNYNIRGISTKISNPFF